jgi:NADH:ubiquinone oxidoreductase subunit E
MEANNILKIVESHKGDRGGVICILEDIQSKYGFLPEKALRIVAEQTGSSLVDVYGIATFYKYFSLEPRGKHLISVCMGTACHVRGGPEIAEEFERNLEIKHGETTRDKEFTLETVNCLGACALGPIVVVDGHYFTKVKIPDVKRIIRKAKAGLDKARPDADFHLFPLEVSCPRCNHSFMDHKYYLDGCASIRVTVSFGHKHGWLRLSSLYGSYTVASEYEIPLNTEVNFFCPHCHAELNSAEQCMLCGASMVPMIVSNGGMVQICSRRGCRSHMLDVSGVNF